MFIINYNHKNKILRLKKICEKKMILIVKCLSFLQEEKVLQSLKNNRIVKQHAQLVIEIISDDEFGMIIPQNDFEIH